MSFHSPFSFRVRNCYRAAFLLGLLFWVTLPLAPAAEPTEPAAPTITDPVQIWSLTPEQRNQAQPLKIEGRVSYYDPGFKMLWLECNQNGNYLLLSDSAPAIRTGQYVAIEGTFTPKNGLDAKDVTVRVIEEMAPITPLPTNNRINDFDALHARIVTVEGYVDSQQYVDDQHYRLILIVENRPVICWIKPDDPKNVPNWQGNFVRATGLYSRKFDPTRTSATIELWLGRQDGFQVIDTLDNSAQFARPVTAVEDLYRQHLIGTDVRVRGRIEKHVVGKAMTVRDATGQVEILSIQQQRLPVGTEVEAIGKVNRSSGQWVIDTAFYRPVAKPAAGDQLLTAVPNGVLRTVAQIRMLGAEEAAQSRSVEITGMVIWVLPDSQFLYLQDLTGGVRVYFDKAKTGEIRYGKYFTVKGVTRAGRVAPEVELREFADLGSMSHPPAKPITLEQALSGKEEGEWIELRGFVQEIVSEGDWRWIHVTTPAGDFTGLLQNPVSFVANPGSLIRIAGVCDTTELPDRHTKGVTLRVPFIHNIAIEEDAPADYFALPHRPLADLAQLSTSQDMLRVRVTGTVQYAIPGRLIYLEEGSKGVLLLTRIPEALQPGDRIEAVGILGREGARTLLRETVFHKLGAAASTHAPLKITDVKRLEPSADSRLVTMQGTLIDHVSFAPQGQTRLTLQQGNTLFEATLEQSAGTAALKKLIGAELEVTGVYELKFDDSRQASGFQLHLRSAADLAVLRSPRLWTLQRALTVVAVLAGSTMLGLFWIRSLRRQVQQQTTQLRVQLEHQARLEAEVQRAARLESLGVLAGGIAHDYNNLLTIVMGNLSLMKFTPQVIALEGGRVEEIEKAALRARDLTRQLLTFAEGGEPVRTQVDLAELLHAAQASLPRSPSITADDEIAHDLPPVQVDRDQIFQAVQNLLRNALEAMPAGGCIRIMAGITEVYSGNNHLPPGRYIRTSIIDTGEGIPVDLLSRIFDPYFSTKKSGGGLGLATVYSIIKKHQGHIEVHSRPRQGATFTFWLPVMENPNGATQIHLPLPLPELSTARPIAPVPATVTVPTAPPRVLLMDDEESIRKLGTILLERMGCAVISARNGTEGLKLYREALTSQMPFALLVLDLTVNGGMGGLEVIQQIRQTDPTTPAIVSSGYSRDPVMAHHREYGFQAIIPKPYDIKRFRDTVTALLPGGASSTRP